MWNINFTKQNKHKRDIYKPKRLRYNNCMEKIEFKKDEESYSSSKGRYLKYFFEKETSGLFQIGETDDYFYFTIMLRDGYLKNEFKLTINEQDVLYEYFSTFLKGFSYIEVMEEGTPEKKSITFIKNENNIEIIFKLTEEEKVFYSIELANLRRLGDTRFAKLVPTKNMSEQEFYEMESTFRYKFKTRIHQMLDELENKYKTNKETLV